MNGGSLQQLASQTRFDFVLLWRNPLASFFTVVLPLIFLFVLTALFGNDLVTPAGPKLASRFVPGIIRVVGGPSLLCESGHRHGLSPGDKHPQKSAGHPNTPLGIHGGTGRHRLRRNRPNGSADGVDRLGGLRRGSVVEDGPQPDRDLDYWGRRVLCPWIGVHQPGSQ